MASPRAVPAVRPVLLALVLVATACGGSPARPEPRSVPDPAPRPAVSVPPGADPVLLAVGDIADCSSLDDEATAALVADRPGTLAALGDLAYESGTAAEFADCYDPSWGPFKARTRPVPGNHEYRTPGASGYFAYFGASAGDPATGYYSYDIGAWHVVALNSNCEVVSCAAGDAQETWLRADLAAHPSACTVAYWHHPRFSSGTVHGPNTAVQPLWQALHDHDADLVLAAHEHNYERFGPLTATGVIDEARGIRSFVVGTGGRSHYALGPAIVGSEIRDGTSYGILALTLHQNSYDWHFVAQPDATFADSGSASCH